MHIVPIPKLLKRMAESLELDHICDGPFEKRNIEFEKARQKHYLAEMMKELGINPKKVEEL